MHLAAHKEFVMTDKYDDISSTGHGTFICLLCVTICKEIGNKEQRASYNSGEHNKSHVNTGYKSMLLPTF